MAGIDLGPWASSFDTRPRVELSGIWRRRLALLPRTAKAECRPATANWATIAAVALIAVTVPAISLTSAPAATPPDANPTATPPVREPARATGEPIRVELPGGAVAEIVAIGYHPSHEKRWWGPDGHPTAAPYYSFSSRVNPGENFMVREIAVRWVTRPAGLALSYGVEGGGSAAAGKPKDEQGLSADNLYTTAQAFPKDAKSATVRFTVGMGDWETVATTDGRSDFSMGDQKYSIAFCKAALRPEGLALSVAHSITDQNVRIVAVGRDDRITSAPYCVGNGGRGFLQTTGVFPGRALEDIKEFRVEARSYRHVDVRNLSLMPDEITEPQIVAVADEQAN